MDISFSVFFKSIPLVKPYNLSFGPIKTFDTFYIIAKSLDSESQFSIGEVTPLPGYNHETVKSVTKSLNAIFHRAQTGEPLAEVLSSYRASAPFAVSGVAVSIELLHKYSMMAQMALDGQIPLTALCDAASPALIGNRAAELCSQGFSTLKMKVGQRDIVDELDRIQSVASNIPPHSSIRLDANQCYSFNQALQLCHGLEKINYITLLEQPFKSNQWGETEELVKETNIPIMLDESIWTVSDVDRAASIGVQYVKFKLCKHFGFEGSFDLIRKAKSYNMGIIYGNGVQTAVGNHYEALIHAQADIHTASEGNGFLKIKDSVFKGAMSMREGHLYDSGLDHEIFQKDHWKCVIPELILSLDDINFLCHEQ